MAERWRWVWLFVVLIAGIGGLAAGGVLYTNAVQREAREETVRVEREAQADLCELMRVFDDPTAPPPTTDRGRAQVAAIRAYLLKRC